MPKVIVTHAVEDIDRWLQGREARAAEIGTAGGRNVTEYLAKDGSNNIAVTVDAENLDALESMLASPSPETLALMQSHGVIPPLTAYVQAD